MTDYPYPPAYYDSLISDVMGYGANASGHTDLKSIQGAMDAWQTYGTMLQDLMRDQGTQSNGYISGDVTAPQLTLMDLVQQHLSGWTGPARDQYVAHAQVVQDFGSRVGQTMYQPGNQGNTFYQALSSLLGGLTYIDDNYPRIYNAYQKWLTTLANNLAGNLNTSGSLNTSPNDPTRNLPKWATTNVNIDLTNINAQAGTCTVSITVNDGPETHTLTVPGTYQAGGHMFGAQFGVDPSRWSVNDIRQWLSEKFTKLYKSLVGPLADVITSKGGAGQ